MKIVINMIIISGILIGICSILAYIAKHKNNTLLKNITEYACDTMSIFCYLTAVIAIITVATAVFKSFIH